MKMVTELFRGRRGEIKEIATAREVSPWACSFAYLAHPFFRRYSGREMGAPPRRMLSSAASMKA